MILSTDDIRARVEDLLIEAIGTAPPGIGETSPLDGMDGWDSVARVVLIAAVESEFGVRIESGDFDGVATIGELTAMIARGLSGGEETS